MFNPNPVSFLDVQLDIEVCTTKYVGLSLLVDRNSFHGNLGFRFIYNCRCLRASTEN